MNAFQNADFARPKSQSQQPTATHRTFRLVITHIAVLAISLTSAFATLAQQVPQLNVPYKCPDGRSFIFLSCTPVKTDQWCTSRWEQNGQVITTVNSYYSQMTGRLQGCTTPNANQPANSGNTPKAAAAQTAAPQFPAPGTALNPSYLSEFPPPDQIMAKLQGSSPADTSNQQLGAFREFKQMIQDLAGNRWDHNQITPDESRVWGAYDIAYNNLARPLNFPLDGYFGRGSFAQKLFSTFQMTNVKKLCENLDPQNAAAQKARQQQPGASTQTAGGPSSAGITPLPPTTDPTALASRRCVELGGALGRCSAEGFSAGAKALIGLDLSALDPSVHGLVVFGSYKNQSGTLIAFSDVSVVISGCGKLVGGAHAYSIQPFGNQYAVKIENQPQALLVGIGADGKLTGPAAQAISGNQITGYNVVTNLRTGAEVSRTPVYGPVTQTCTIGAIPPGPPQAAQQDMVGSMFDVFSALGTLFGTDGDTSNQSQAPTIAPGVRFAGVYTSGSDLRIIFQDANAVIDCKQAHIMVPYDVVLKGSVASVNVKSGNPFTVTPAPNGSLVGPASVTVNGKLFTAVTADTQPILTPTSATCSAASLSQAKPAKQ